MLCFPFYESYLNIFLLDSILYRKSVEVLRRYLPKPMDQTNKKRNSVNLLKPPIIVLNKYTHPEQ